MKVLKLVAIAGAGLLLAPAVQAARVFEVRAGETVVITPETKIDQYYNSLILREGSRLVIKVPNLVLKVGEIQIGDNVQILGNGRDGVDGPNAKSDKPTAGLGDGGWPGDNGGAGSPGESGATVTLITGRLLPIGSNFRVELKGGAGGRGGDGGQGGHGGPAECHQVAGDGGPGGDGRAGGAGGSGGKFTLLFSSYGGQAAFLVLGPDKFLVEGGAGGEGGSKGAGGHGGDGVNCGPLLGGARPGGGGGGDGKAGERGRAGVRGLAEIRPI
jgi:hypothetical protein